MRYSFVLILFLCVKSFSQIPLYELVSLEYNSLLPDDLNSSRSAVIVNVPNKNGEFVEIGNWKKFAEDAHSGFVKMNVDAIFSISQTDLTASSSTYLNYLDIFEKRRVKNLIFLTQKEDGVEIVVTQNKNTDQLLTNGQSAYRVKEENLKGALLSFGREVRRAELVQGNFLIPDKASFLTGRSIIENTQLKNYPGQLRRSVLAIERFKKIPEKNSDNEGVRKTIQAYNEIIEKKNLELDSIMKSYPFEYVLIDAMSDEDLLRNRYQFLARSITGAASSVRNMLEFDVIPSETDFVSVIPVMPDRTSIKTIPKDAIVTKFYVRQNISKNVHVGEWDADETWQSALKNMIGNLSQRLVIKN